MAIVNSAATFTGVGSQVVQNLAVAIVQTAAPGQTVRVPASGSISPAVARGYARCKFYNTTSAITITSVQVNANDGTNTCTIDTWSPAATIAITSTAYVDVLFDFIFDTSTAGGGATGTLIFGGATFFNFLVISATGSGACSGDFEVAVQP